MGRKKLAIQVPCAFCQELIWRQPSELKGVRTVFCSKQCQGFEKASHCVERFWARVDSSNGPETCWPWIGAHSIFGHGALSIYSKHTYAHIVAYELTYGPLLPMVHVLHRCDNPPCCNPNHLFVGTKGDNARDASAKGRIAFGMRHGSARLSDADIDAIWQCHGYLTQEAIGKLFGVTNSHISNIFNKKVRIKPTYAR